MKQLNHVRSRVAALVLGGLAMIACVGEGVTALKDMPLPPNALAFVNASPPASIVAVGGTQQLGATGLTVTGAAVTTFDSLVFQHDNPGDSTRLTLSRTGLVTGLVSTGSGIVRINVIGFKDRVLRGDQVIVQVTPTAASGLVFSVQPVPPDSAKLAAGTTKAIVPVLRNPTTGVAVSNPAVLYKIKGPDSARVDTYHGRVTYRITSADVLVVRPLTSNFGLQPNQVTALSGEGTAWIYATINAYGTEFKDSVQYSFSYPYRQTISTVKTNLAVQSIFADQTVTLAPGATLTFQNGVASTDLLTVAYTFDNPAAASAASPASTTGGASGNVTTLTGGQSSRRQFLTPGTYRWTVTTAGGPAPWPGQTLSGTILIK